MKRLDFSRLAHGYEPPKPGQMERLRADSYNREIGHLNDEDGYDCPLCLNRGSTMTVVEDGGNYYIKAVPCKCMNTRNSIMRMKRSGLEKLIARCKFESYEATDPWQKKLKGAAMAFAEKPEGWFYLGGQSGCGKTHLCTAICRKLLLDGRNVLYMLWRDEVTRLKGLLNSEEYSAEMRKFKEIDVLYIDDLFKTGRMDSGMPQRPSAGDINLAFELLNYRINNKKITVISSECTAAELLDIDEAIGGRIADGNNVFSVGHDHKKNYRLRSLEEL